MILPVLDPWTLGTIATVESTPPARIEAALARAHLRRGCMPPAYERARLLERAADAVEADAEAFAQGIRGEAGKPIVLARAEVARAVGTLRLCAAEARTLAGEAVALEGTAEGSGRIGLTIREARGVVLAITPFNFPLNLVVHKVAPAIAAGCPVVLKPAERTPLSAERLARVFLDAGAEPGMLEVVQGVGADIVPGLVTDPRVAVVSFTGSAAVGRRIQARAPRVPVLLELGGAAAVLVDEGVDVEPVARAVVAGAYAYAGQSCISVQRIIACAGVLDPLREALVEATRSIAVGAPSDPEVRVGPLIRPSEADRVRAWAAEATAAGARLIAGDLAVRADDPAGLLRPLLLEGVPDGARVLREEVFGPLACIVGVGDLRDAVDVANLVPDALNVGVYARDAQRALAATRGLHAGAVVWNESPTWRADGMPYGSADGTREGPRWTVRAFTREKLLVLGGS